MPAGAERIIEVATRLFGERSYPSTSMRDISEAVGILPGSLYTHISSKEVLLLQIVETGIDKYLEAVTPIATSSAPADARMQAAVKAAVAVATENIEQTVVSTHQWKYLNEANRARVMEKRIAYEKLFTRIVDDGIKSGVFRPTGNPKLAVFALIGMLNWVPEWYSPTGPNSVDDIGDALADLALAGLTGSPATTGKKRSSRDGPSSKVTANASKPRA